jgi:hypothetical protein
VLKLALLLLVLLIAGVAAVALRPEVRAAFDRARYPRQGFSLRYSSADLDVDSASGIVTQHRSGNPPTDRPIPLQLPPAAMDHIYELAIETHAFDLPPRISFAWTQPVPAGESFHLVLNAGKARRDYFWDPKDIPSESWRVLPALAAAIDSTVRAEPEFARLEPVRGRRHS